MTGKRHVVHRPPGPRSLELARLADMLLQGAPADDTAQALSSMLRLPSAAVRLALQLVDHDGRGKRATKHQPRPRGEGQLQRAQAKIEAYYRAAYVRASSKRIAARLKAGDSPTEAVRTERRYWMLHEKARRARQMAADEVARTSAVVGRNEAGQPLLGWYAHPDDRVTPECKAADGANFRADVQPMIGWPGTLHGGTCFPAGVEVHSPGTLAATARWYSGEVVEVQTVKGDHFTVTPNHPVLTPQGWVAAGLLDQGSEVVRALSPEQACRLIDPHHAETPSLIENVAGSLSERIGVIARTVPVAAEDFHGDGFGAEVYVVGADRVLRDGGDAALTQPSRVQQLQRPTRRSPVPGAGLLGLLLQRPFTAAAEGPRVLVPLTTAILGPSAASDSFMRRLSVARMLLWTAPAHHQAVGFGLGPQGDASLSKYSFDRFAADPVGAGYGRHTVPATIVGDDGLGVQFDAVVRLAALLELGQVASVRRRRWAGHVFNLQSVSEYYIANGIVVHNCRCRPGPPWPTGRTVDRSTARFVSKRNL